jgi:hypothetical protein
MSESQCKFNLIIESENTIYVIPANAGIQCVPRAKDANIRCFAWMNDLDSGLRQNDDCGS